MLKIKKIVLALSLFIAFLYFVPAPQAAKALGLEPCKSFSGSAQTDCQDCHPKDNTLPPSLCACHPEYFYGQALSSSELKSCTVCNKNYNNNYAQQTNSCISNPNNPITKTLNLFVNVLSGLAVLIIIGVMIAGGIQHSIASSPTAATAARKRIANAGLALILFIFIWGILQWLIPGGL